MAAILHDVVEDTPVTLEEVEADFGAEVALLVNGLTKAADERLSRQALKAKTYRKQLLAAIEDVRVLCLKFWDRMDNLQTISALNPQKQSLIAEETRSIYVPLARHLGMGLVASEPRCPVPGDPLSAPRRALPGDPPPGPAAGGTRVAEDPRRDQQRLRAQQDSRPAAGPLAPLLHRRGPGDEPGPGHPLHARDSGRPDHGRLPRPRPVAQSLSPDSRKAAGSPQRPFPVRLPGAEDHRAGRRKPAADRDHHPQAGAFQRIGRAGAGIRVPPGQFPAN